MKRFCAVVVMMFLSCQCILAAEVAPRQSPAALPDFAKQYPVGDVIDIQQADFKLFKEGEVSEIVEDAVASDKKAARFPGDVPAWSVQVHLGKILKTHGGKWQVNAMVRIAKKEGTEISGLGVSAGTHDEVNKKGLGTVTVAFEMISGDYYHQIDMGVHAINAGMWVWVGPAASASNPSVDKIYVDRIILIRQRP